MAPKGKAAAKPDAKAAGKGKGAEGGPTKLDPVLVAKHKKIIGICVILSVVSIGVISVMFSMYSKLEAREKELKKPFEDLRESVAKAADDKRFLTDKPDLIAKEVKALEARTNKAKEANEVGKKEYKDLFYKPSSRSSSRPWKLHGKNNYYFSKGEKTWYDAEEFCMARGAHLASIINDEEQNFISSQLQHTSWIGLKVENEKGEWRWSDDSGLVKEYWSENEPRKSRVFWRSNQDCAIMAPSLTFHNWKENNCHKLHKWVCKEKLDLD